MGFIDRIVSRSSKYGLGDDDCPSKADQRSPVEESLLARLHQASDQSCDTGEAQSEPAQLRLHLRFIGTVQGVGFRWTNQGIANQLNLTGWVRNNSDGSVEMEIQEPPRRHRPHVLDAVHAYRRFNNPSGWTGSRITPQTDGQGVRGRY